MSKEISVAGSKIYTIDDNGNCEELAPNELLISDEHFNVIAESINKTPFEMVLSKYLKGGDA